MASFFFFFFFFLGNINTPSFIYYLLYSLQKITVALRMLAYGVPTDSTDKYVRIEESTVIESLKKFVKEVINIFSE
jgi:transposase-like protein